MADFVQMMKDWKRMCNAMGQEDEYTACDKCNLRDFDCPAIYEKECDNADWNHVESVVTTWAAEHPEPVYPKWGEWLENKYHDRVSEIVFQSIPADIAQKLGIEPLPKA